MAYLIAWILLLLMPTMSHAAKWRYVPTPVDVWAVCDTSHRCAAAEDAVFDPGSWASVVDTTADGGDYLGMLSGTRDFQTQLAMEIDTTCNYLWLRAKGTGIAWLSKTPFGPVPSNTAASILFNGGVAADWTWTRIGSRADENLQRVNEGSSVPINDTAQRDFAFTSGNDLYVLTQPSVMLDSWYCSTDANANPVSPGGDAGVTVNYALYEVVDEPTIDDAQWDRASIVAKAGHSTTPAADMLIAAVWKNGTPDRICVRGEETLANQSWVDVAEDDTAIANYQAVFAYLRMTSLDRVKDENTWLLGISPQADKYDATWPSGVFSTTADLANLALSQSTSGDRRRMQACFDSPVAIATGSQWLCDFRQQERVTGGTMKYKQAFNLTSSPTDVAQWGVCEAGPALPAAPVDNTAPSVGSVAFSNVTQTSFTVTATASDAQTGISACHVVYDLTNDNAVTFGTDPSVQGTMAGGSCSATVTGLSAGTAYEAAVYAVNGVGLSTTGAVGDQTTSAASAFYVSTGGSGSTCSSGSPCALSRLMSTSEPRPSPGETWILQDGTYNITGSNFVNLNCASGGNALNGTASAPITLQADNERLAWLKTNGLTPALRITSCNYWHINGLRFSSRDNDGSGEGFSTVEIRSSHNLRFYRNLAHHSNRFGNMSLFQNGDSTTTASHDNQFIENEFYYFHRYGLVTKYGSRTIARLNYCNSRGYMDATGGFPSGTVSQGDLCAREYPGSGGITESNISEDSGHGFSPEPSSTSTNNQFYGNIVMGGIFGALAQGKSGGGQTVDMLYRDHLIVSPSTYGFYMRAGRNTRCEQCTVFGSQRGYIYASSLSTPGTAPRSMFLQNVLSIAPTVWGFYTDEVNLEDWGANYVAVMGSTGGTFTPAATHANITNEITGSNPMGNCRVWVPTTATTLKGTGLNGQDVGAEVLYLYQNGTKTTAKLWDTGNSGKWLGAAGATVSGTNPTFSATTLVTSADLNTVTNSPQDVHSRLNIMSAGCLPGGY
jgi:hypothetical protein